WKFTISSSFCHRLEGLPHCFICFSVCPFGTCLSSMPTCPFIIPCFGAQTFPNSPPKEGQLRHKRARRTKPRPNSPRRAVYLFLKSHAILTRMAGEEKPKIFENSRDRILSLGGIVTGILAVVAATGLCTLDPDTAGLPAVPELDAEGFFALE